MRKRRSRAYWAVLLLLSLCLLAHTVAISSGRKEPRRRVMVVRDPGPMARLEQVKSDVMAPAEIFHRLSEGETLAELAKAWKVPKGRFVEWFTVGHADLYDAALKVRAADLALEALKIADEQAEVVKENGEAFDPNVGRDKLRIETRLKLASKFDRARYGETVRVEKSVTVGVDAGLLGFAGALLGQIRAPRVIEGVPSPALPAPAAPAVVEPEPVI